VGYASAAIAGRFHLFLARSLSPANGNATREGTERDLIARPIALTEAIEAAMDGRIEHGMSVVGLLRAARRLGV
jgi:hypothetical protein